MIKLSGLWLNTSKKGEKYFSGALGGGRIVILKNQFKKEGSNEPDYEMYLKENEPSQVKVEAKKDDDPFADDVPQ